MKANLHPTYHQAKATCACGNSFVVGSTVADLRIDICSKCHPFYTGEQPFVDILGRVDKFIARRRAAAPQPKKGKKRGQVETKQKALPLKEMLTVTKTA